MTHFFVEYVKSLVPINWRELPSGWWNGNCQVCLSQGESRSDIKRRGNFIFSDNSIGYNCYNCNFKVKWEEGSYNLSDKMKKLLFSYGAFDEDINQIKLLFLKEKINPNLDFNLKKKDPLINEVTKKWIKVELPYNTIKSVKLTDEVCKSGMDYIRSRQLDFWKDWYYNDSLVYKNRIILPYRYKKTIVGHTSRLVKELKNKNKPKYISKQPPDFIFNLDNQIDTRDYIIITEGEMDAISLDCVSICHNTISDKQAAVLNSMEKIKIVLPDADRAGNKIMEDGIKYGWRVSFPEWMEKHKDANSAICEYGRSFVLHSVIESAINNETKIRVLGKKYLKD